MQSKQCALRAECKCYWDLSGFDRSYEEEQKQEASSDSEEEKKEEEDNKEEEKKEEAKTEWEYDLD